MTRLVDAAAVVAMLVTDYSRILLDDKIAARDKTAAHCTVDIHPAVR